ncbi:conjugal transfer protein [Streptosporangium nondiastaticum]|uniref:conjugal transfer protein n=1 Tax=Streptosporangium nondiastaticum TaxID=35764 RepID=UPI0016746BD8|nr:conjugal transfer protein [Streptosporangium nondiastaticum]
MSTFKTVMRRILNLPEPKSDKNAAPAQQQPAAPAPAPVQTPPAPAGLQQWADAAARLQAQDGGPVRATDASAGQQPLPGSPGKPSAGQLPWQIEDENSGTKFAVKVGRGVLWGVVALAAITGIRSWIWTPEPPKPVPTKVDSGPNYPIQEAQAVAARFARAYLTWDDADPQARADALSRDMPKGTDTTTGWNSKGRQEVVVAQPGSVSVLADKRARVRVDVLVKGPASAAQPKQDDKQDDKKTDDKKKDDKPKPSTTKWMGLEVPVVQASGRIVVTGQPGIVGVPASGPSVADPETKPADMAFSQRTRDVIEEFFKKYATGEPDAVAAPGAYIPALPAGMTPGGVRNWSVDEGSGTERVGTAVINWQLGDAELEQTYRVKVARVTSAQGAERWQVSEVHGGLTP